MLTQAEDFGDYAQIAEFVSMPTLAYRMPHIGIPDLKWAQSILNHAERNCNAKVFTKLKKYMLLEGLVE